MVKRLRREATATYHKAIHQWLKFHYHVLLLCIAISAIFEIVIYLIIRTTGIMYDSDWVYWLKYIVTPIGIGFSIALLSLIVIRHKRLRTSVKYYIMSFLMVLVATYLSFVHSGYIAILFAFLLPILMTIMYENQKLTICVTLFTIPLELYTAFSMFWDPNKEITHGYIINLIIIVVLTIVTWMISYYMIRYSLRKREAIIKRDMERQELKERVLLDDLTNVGNKHALFSQLKLLEQTGQKFHLAMMDIDDFKMINDRFGHLYGDEVLRSLGSVLQHMRSECSGYRYGGDEFSVIIMDEHKEHVLQDMKNLQVDFQDTLRESKRSMMDDITISIGISIYDCDVDNLDILKRADVALYASKKKGRSIITYEA